MNSTTILKMVAVTVVTVYAIRLLRASNQSLGAIFPQTIVGTSPAVVTQ